MFGNSPLKKRKVTATVSSGNRFADSIFTSAIRLGTSISFRGKTPLIYSCLRMNPPPHLGQIIGVPRALDAAFLLLEATTIISPCKPQNGQTYLTMKGINCFWDIRFSSKLNR